MKTQEGVEVTFVMPAYNVGRYLGAAVRSLQAQTVEVWRLVIVDDGSTDGTLKIARELAREDERITVVEAPRHAGCAFAPRRQAAELAGTRWIAPVDADDIVPPDYLQRLLQWQLHADAQAVFPTLYTFDGNPSTLAEVATGSRQAVPAPGAASDFTAPGRELVRLTLPYWTINCGGGLIDRCLFLKACHNCSEAWQLIFSDELLSRYLLFDAPRVAITSIPYYYRQHPSSVTHSPRYFDKFELHRHLSQAIEKLYGADSDEYRLALQTELTVWLELAQLFSHKSLHLTPQQRLDILRKASATRQRLLRQPLLKDCSQSHHRLLLRLGFRTASLLLPSLQRVKNGVKTVLRG